MTYREIIRYLDKAFLKIRATQKSATISNVFQSVEDITATIVKNTHQQYKALIRVLKDNSTTTSLEHSQIAVETKILLNNFNKALRKSLDENTLPIAENKVIVEMVMKALKLQPAPQSHIIIEFFNGILNLSITCCWG
jgi:stalled ribosome rescue protein Dom34